MRLVERGVTAAVAGRLVAEHPEAEVLERLAAFDWLVGRRDGRVSKSPAGYLVESIRKGYAPPKGFESDEGRARRLDQEVERRRRADEERDRAELERRGPDDAEEGRLRDFWEGLDEAGRDDVRRRALAEVDGFLARQYRRHEGAGTEAEHFYLRAIVEEYLARTLKAGEADLVGGKGVV